MVEHAHRGMICPRRVLHPCWLWDPRPCRSLACQSTQTRAMLHAGCKAYAPNEPVSGAFVSRTSTPESTSPSRRNFPRGRVDNNILSCTLVIQDFFLVQIAAFAVFSFIRSGPGAICNAISPFRTGRPFDLGRPAPSSTPADPSLLLRVLRSFPRHCRYRSLPFVGQHG